MRSSYQNQDDWSSFSLPHSWYSCCCRWKVSLTFMGLFLSPWDEILSHDRAEMVKREWVKPGAVVIDCGNFLQILRQMLILMQMQIFKQMQILLEAPFTLSFSWSCLFTPSLWPNWRCKLNLDCVVHEHGNGHGSHTSRHWSQMAGNLHHLKNFHCDGTNFFPFGCWLLPPTHCDGQDWIGHLIVVHVSHKPLTRFFCRVRDSVDSWRSVVHTYKTERYMWKKSNAGNAQNKYVVWCRHVVCFPFLQAWWQVLLLLCSTRVR